MILKRAAPELQPETSRARSPGGSPVPRPSAEAAPRLLSTASDNIHVGRPIQIQVTSKLEAATADFDFKLGFNLEDVNSPALNRIRDSLRVRWPREEPNALALAI